jgi:hypothetical protein
VRLLQCDPSAQAQWGPGPTQINIAMPSA